MSFVLLNDADLVTIHEIGKAILCLVRDWCNRCGLHGVSRRDVHNLVDLADLVERGVPLDELAHLDEFRIGSRLVLGHYLH